MIIEDLPLEILALQSGGYEVVLDNVELTRFTSDDEELNYQLAKAFSDGVCHLILLAKEAGK